MRKEEEIIKRGRKLKSGSVKRGKRKKRNKRELMIPIKGYRMRWNMFKKKIRRELECNT